MDFLEIFAKLQAIVGNLFLLFHALCGTVFSRFSSLVFALPAQRACKGILPRFLALAHSCVDTESLSLLSALFEQFAHITSGFTTIPSCLIRTNAHYACVRICARYGAPDHVGATAFALRKMRRTLLLSKRKNAIDHYILSKRRPHVVFGGTAFWRHGVLSTPRDKTPSSRILSTAPDIDSRASQTAEFAVISGFAARVISFPVHDRVSKNTRRFRALSAFEKSSLTSAHIRRPFLASFAAFDPRLQSSSATLRARAAPLGSPPRKPLPTF